MIFYSFKISRHHTLIESKFRVKLKKKKKMLNFGTNVNQEKLRIQIKNYQI